MEHPDPAVPRSHRTGVGPGARTTAARPADLFAALGDPHRLRIVRDLSHRGPQSIASLTDGSGVSRQAISKHIAVLERAGLLRGTRRGRERVVALESPRLLEGRRFLSDVATEWDAALVRLRRLLEA